MAVLSDRGVLARTAWRGTRLAPPRTASTWVIRVGVPRSAVTSQPGDQRGVAGGQRRLHPRRPPVHLAGARTLAAGAFLAAGQVSHPDVHAVGVQAPGAEGRHRRRRRPEAWAPAGAAAPAAGRRAIRAPRTRGRAARRPRSTAGTHRSRPAILRSDAACPRNFRSRGARVAPARRRRIPKCPRPRRRWWQAAPAGGRRCGPDRRWPIAPVAAGRGIADVCVEPVARGALPVRAALEKEHRKPLFRQAPA